MIEFKIKSNGKPKIANTFEIELDFMKGDADGTKYVRFYFPDDKINDPLFLKDLEDFLLSISECIKLDSRGRGGFDDLESAIGHYGVVSNWAKYCETVGGNVEDEEYEENEWTLFDSESPFIYDIPTDEGWYTSYHGLKLYFYNEDGTKFEVEWKTI